ncbi:PucR family transcriptional regulator [Streptomyces iranensis]|uniref:PucR family transcriptional regulator n=1 Tax=Streptomyces iranensis TaxID=576784 RepID=UPI0039B783C6
MGHGIGTSARPVRLPANREFGMLSRVCFPIRRDGVLLGYLWLFDEPRVVDGEMTRVGQTVAELAELMWADDAALHGRADDMNRLLVAAMQEETAAEAVREALRLGYLSSDGAFAVHAVDLGPGTRTVDTQARKLLLELARRQIGRPFLAGLTEGALLTVSRSRTPRDTSALQAALYRAAQAAGYRTVYVGAAAAESAPSLPAVAHRARFAADLAALRGEDSSALHWENLGSWRIFQGRALTPATVREVSEDAYVLLREGSPEHWQTVVSYLDAGRSAPVACAALTIHRTTLYYRLDRVRQLIGSEALDDGWRAVALHVALKLHECLKRTGRVSSEFGE